mmetsp:Transcript_12313/g.32469  ORF Transcript_12313/g.32469 Transcript_12313/m.32469 type:complete len:485 (-) Transcript_12313:767-2221(-)
MQGEAGRAQTECSLDKSRRACSRGQQQQQQQQDLPSAAQQQLLPDPSTATALAPRSLPIAQAQQTQDHHGPADLAAANSQAPPGRAAPEQAPPFVPQQASIGATPPGSGFGAPKSPPAQPPSPPARAATDDAPAPQPPPLPPPHPPPASEPRAPPPVPPDPLRRRIELSQPLASDSQPGSQSLLTSGHSTAPGSLLPQLDLDPLPSPQHNRLPPLPPSPHTLEPLPRPSASPLPAAPVPAPPRSPPHALEPLPQPPMPPPALPAAADSPSVPGAADTPSPAIAGAGNPAKPPSLPPLPRSSGDLTARRAGGDGPSLSPFAVVKMNSQPSPRKLNQASSLPGPLDSLTDGAITPRDKVNASTIKSAGSGPPGLSPPPTMGRPPQAPFQRSAMPQPDLQLSLGGSGLQASTRTPPYRGSSASGFPAEQSTSLSQETLDVEASEPPVPTPRPAVPTRYAPGAASMQGIQEGLTSPVRLAERHGTQGS